MKKLFFLLALLLGALKISAVQTIALATASNDPENNELLIYDASGKLLQSLATKGKGGVPRNTVGGGIAKSYPYVAVINYNSQSVSLFKQQQNNTLKFVQVVTTLSKPVSVAFSKQHLYILGTNTIESHQMTEDLIMERPDGSSKLLVGDGSGAQVGVLMNQLIASERSNTIQLIDLKGGAVTEKIQAIQLPPPPDNDTPVGLATRGDMAYVTIAHSNKVGLVKNGKLIKVVSSENQKAPCWLALSGEWLFCTNTPSKTISRYRVSANDLILAEPIAAKTQGEPTDIDAENGVVAVIEFGQNGAFITQFQFDDNGKMKLVNSTPTSKNANGIAILKR